MKVAARGPSSKPGTLTKSQHSMVSSTASGCHPGLVAIPQGWVRRGPLAAMHGGEPRASCMNLPTLTPSSLQPYLQHGAQVGGDVGHS